METTLSVGDKTIRFQMSIPMTKIEHEKLEIYLIKSGTKKGAFVRQAIIEKLAREEHSDLHVVKDEE